APDGRVGDIGKPDFLFGAGAGDPDAAGCALSGVAAAGSFPLADPGIARLLWRIRPLASDSRLPHGNDIGAGAVSLFANGLDDFLRLRRVPPVARPLDTRRQRNHR